MSPRQPRFMRAASYACCQARSAAAVSPCASASSTLTRATRPTRCTSSSWGLRLRPVAISATAARTNRAAVSTIGTFGVGFIVVPPRSRRGASAITVPYHRDHSTACDIGIYEGDACGQRAVLGPFARAAWALLLEGDGRQPVEARGMQPEVADLRTGDAPDEPHVDGQPRHVVGQQRLAALVETRALLPRGELRSEERRVGKEWR